MPSNKMISELFARMQAVFGHRWASAIEGDGVYEAAVAEWKYHLAGLSGAEIGAGFDRMRKRRGDDRAWPPTPIAFRELCRPHREPYERAEFQGNALPQLPADKATAQAHLAKLRQRMGGAA